METMIIGVDTGGTFTDFVYYDGKEVKVLKVPSTPKNPALAVLEGLKAIGGSGRRIIHGSTVATNALLERKGAKVALVTNRGFEDVIEIGRQNRTRLYDLHYRKPKPLVPRDCRFGIKGRLSYRGQELEPLDEEEIRNLAKLLKEKGIESVAVCLLHSYANTSHEEKVGKILTEETGLFVSLSSSVVREFREYERMSTTVINAYVSPKMATYITHLEENLAEGDTLQIMQSNGGLITSERAKREAVRTILSGPAGGIVSALHLGKVLGVERIITFDMGGTSTDVALIDRSPVVTTEGSVEGFPVKIPMIDIHTIGAGGGSIAWIDEGGILRVGPQSAGADPGPICYGRGGKDVTVTDANLFLGRLLEDHFLGGKFKLYPEKVKPYIRDLARRLGVGERDLALAVLSIANSNMERAIRRVSVQRGYNPADFYLLTYGGAGGLHAVYLARSLGIPKVIVPQNPGLFSAVGMILADRVRDYSRSVLLRADKISFQELKEILGDMKRCALEEALEEGFSEGEVLFESSLDLRYVGQSYELTVPFCEDFVAEFEKTHERVYGYRHTREVEVVNLRLKAIVPSKKPPLPEFEAKADENPSQALIGDRRVILEEDELKARVYDRDKLLWGNIIRGPAVVVEYSSTTLIPPGAKAVVDRYGNLMIEVWEG